MVVDTRSARITLLPVGVEAVRADRIPAAPDATADEVRTVLDVRIRRFEPGDAPAVRRLHEAAMRDAGDFVEGVPEPDLADVPGHYLDRSGEFLVATRAGEVVGMVAYHPVEEWILADEFAFDDRTAELTRMRVRPDRQREGIGRALYTELERRAVDDGYEAFVLDVSEDNDGARAFYEDLGFDYRETAAFEALGRTFRLAVHRKPIECRRD